MKLDDIIIQKALLILLVAGITSACGTVKRGTVPWEENPTKATSEPSETMDISSRKPEVDEKAAPEIQERQEFLQLAYNDWKGVPYLLGGSGYTGIDCSAFMQVIFEDYFSKIIPRTTLEQLESGEPVRKEQIEAGDMVFFKTGRRTYHVGVMVNQSEFLHASTSEGVKISALEHPFWEETYLAARRVI